MRRTAPLRLQLLVITTPNLHTITRRSQRRRNRKSTRLNHTRRTHPNQRRKRSRNLRRSQSLLGRRNRRNRRSKRSTRTRSTRRVDGDDEEDMDRYAVSLFRRAVYIPRFTLSVVLRYVRATFFMVRGRSSEGGFVYTEFYIILKPALPSGSLRLRSIHITITPPQTTQTTAIFSRTHNLTLTIPYLFPPLHQLLPR